MPSSITFNIFMEKKKRSCNSFCSDDLATVKAAAWAWYQHGSGSEGKPIREFDVMRDYYRQGFRPSRYKLEALRKIEKIKECSIREESLVSSPIHSEDTNSLLDPYEIETISKQLGYLLFDRNLDRQKSCNSTISTSSDISNNSTIKKLMNKKFFKGLWMRHSMVCGRRDDVDSRAFRQITRSLQGQGRHIPMVKS